ncbi:MAG TPA: uracil-DNA glycosylase [Massilibacterium sp.]|nr:uracil-DNA glycosylase [Massilibacterium sp.]
MKQRINCMKCVYFFVTWDRNNPKGCKAFGFKSRQIPSVIVKQSSGHPCFHYTPKEK